jgi:hypothetical protein
VGADQLCPDAADGRHSWQHDQLVMLRRGGVTLGDVCAACGALAAPVPGEPEPV